MTIGSFDEAEIGELAGLYVLRKLTVQLRKENVGLYRDDGPNLDKLSMTQ